MDHSFDDLFSAGWSPGLMRLGSAVLVQDWSTGEPDSLPIEPGNLTYQNYGDTGHNRCGPAISFLRQLRDDGVPNVIAVPIYKDGATVSDWLDGSLSAAIAASYANIAAALGTPRVEYYGCVYAGGETEAASGDATHSAKLVELLNSVREEHTFPDSVAVIRKLSSETEGALAALDAIREAQADASELGSNRLCVYEPASDEAIFGADGYLHAQGSKMLGLQLARAWLTLPPVSEGAL